MSDDGEAIMVNYKKLPLPINLPSLLPFSVVEIDFANFV